MLQQRTCKQCGRSFTGGPRAYYCPICREERTKQTNAAYRARKRAGDVRPIGSVDKCERCGKEYTVEGGLQRFCPDCQPIHAAEYDRETAIDFYRAHKERVNPIRNERRRIDPFKKCVMCGSTYEHKGTKRMTCSPKCEREYYNRQHRERSKRQKEDTNNEQ